jgi:hypothetical protein
VADQAQTRFRMRTPHLMTLPFRDVGHVERPRGMSGTLVDGRPCLDGRDGRLTERLQILVRVDRRIVVPLQDVERLSCAFAAVDYASEHHERDDGIADSYPDVTVSPVNAHMDRNVRIFGRRHVSWRRRGLLAWMSIGDLAEVEPHHLEPDGVGTVEEVEQVLPGLLGADRPGRISAVRVRNGWRGRRRL